MFNYSLLELHYLKSQLKSVKMSLGKIHGKQEFLLILGIQQTIVHSGVTILIELN